MGRRIRRRAPLVAAAAVGVAAVVADVRPAQCVDRDGQRWPRRILARQSGRVVAHRWRPGARPGQLRCAERGHRPRPADRAGAAGRRTVGAGADPWAGLPAFGLAAHRRVLPGAGPGWRTLSRYLAGRGRRRLDRQQHRQGGTAGHPPWPRHPAAAPCGPAGRTAAHLGPAGPPRPAVDRPPQRPDPHRSPHRCDGAVDAAGRARRARRHLDRLAGGSGGRHPVAGHADGQRAAARRPQRARAAHDRQGR